VAHELGNPLTAVRVGAKEIKEHVPDLVETYRAAKRAGLDVATISENHLQFLSRAGEMAEVEANYALMVIDMMLKKAGESSANAYEQERLSILGCVHRAIDQYAFKSSDEKCCVSVAEEPDFLVYANETLVRHVVFNLMQNGLYAIKAARRRDAGTIQVWAVPGHRINRLHFRDNGIGISRETMARVFDPFFTTREQGTGLGLHFCRDVMRRFGGDISCESSPGYFTEIVLVFPATRPSTVSIPTLTQEPGRNGESEDQEHPGWNGESRARPRVLS
jgi:signal transduction histidine kinase